MSEKNEIALQAFELQLDTAFKYGVNLSTRSIPIIGEISSDTFAFLDTALTILEQQSKATITLKINSPGGSVYDALAIVARIQSSKCKIVTEVYGACMSAATMILASGKLRRMSKISWVMHHEAGYYADGTHTQIKHLTEQMDREEKIWVSTMAALTGTPAKFWAEEGRLGKDLYLDSEQCLNLGIVDKIF